MLSKSSNKYVMFDYEENKRPKAQTMFDGIVNKSFVLLFFSHISFVLSLACTVLSKFLNKKVFLKTTSDTGV
jgi:hypothetical protein